MASDKKITIYDVAKATGVSTTTVYKALHGLKGVSDKRREEILAVARSMEYSSNVVAQTLARKDLRIGVILDADHTDFLQKVIDGITFAGQKLCDYKLSVFFANNCNHAAQINKAATLQALEQMLEEDVDGIILYSCISYREFREFGDRLRQKNIPVVTVNNKPSSLDYLACVQYDGALIGKMAGELMNISGKHINSAAFVGNRDILVQNETLFSYGNMLREQDNDLVISFQNQYNEDINEILTGNMLDNYPYLNGLLVGISQSYGIIKTLMERGVLEQYKIVTVDVTPETLDLLANRKILATLDRHPFLLGQLAVDILYEYLTTGCSIKGTIAIPPTVVLPCNAENYHSVNETVSNWQDYMV